MAAALLCGIGNVCALPLRILIEEQHAKIEPGIKKFQQECSGHTDSQACKEEYDALVKALNEFLSKDFSRLARILRNSKRSF